jgi:RHS repeat-associated protein
VVDVALPARAGVGLSFRRHYNSALAGVARALSYGWTHNLEERLIDTHTTTHVTYVREDGKQLRFIRHPTTGVYTSPKGYAFDLVQNGTRYELTAPDGTRRYFDTVSNGFFPGRLIRVENARSQGFSIVHDEWGLVTRARDDFGTELRFFYNGDPIETIRGPYHHASDKDDAAPVLVRYTYGTNWGLERVDTLGAIPGQILESQFYGYDSELRLTEAFGCNGTPLPPPAYCSGSARRSWATYRYDATGRGVEKVDAKEAITVAYRASPRQIVLTDKQTQQTVTLTPHPTLPVLQTEQGSCRCGDGTTVVWDDATLNPKERLGRLGRRLVYHYDATPTHRWLKPDRIDEVDPDGRQQTWQFRYHPLLATPISISRASLHGSKPALVIVDFDPPTTATPATDDDPTHYNKAPTTLPSRIIVKGYTDNDGDGTVDHYTTRVTTYRYDTRGRLLQVDGPTLGNADAVSLTYHPDNSADEKRGRLATIVGPAFSAEVKSYDALGYPRDVVVNGRSISLEFDRRGRLLAQRGPGNAQQAGAYDLSGLLRFVSFGARRIIEFDYNAGGQLSQATPRLDAPGSFSDRRHDALSWGFDQSHRLAGVVALIRGPGDSKKKTSEASFSSDHLGRLRRFTGAAGTWSLAYAENPQDANGAGLRTTLTGSKATHHVDLDGSGLPKQVTLGVGSAEQARYKVTRDTHGNLTAIEWPDGRFWRTVWDDFGQLVSIKTPQVGTISLSYDVAGRLVKQKRGSRSLSYRYDNAGRVTEIADKDGHALLSYRYDRHNDAELRACMLDADASKASAPTGRLVRAQRHQGQTTVSTLWVYDDAGRPVAEATRTDGHCSVVRHRYNGAGERTAIVYPDGKTLQIRRVDDRDGRMQIGRAVGLKWEDAKAELVDEITYEAQGLLTGYRVFGIATQISRDNRRRVSELTVEDPSGTVRHHAKRTTYDSRGKPTKIIVNGQTIQVVHDTLGRLTRYGDVTLAYDSSNRRTGRETGADKEEVTRDTAGRTSGIRVRKTARHKVEYDTEGRAVRVAQHCLRYDDLGKLTELATLPPGASDCRAAATASVRYLYDPLGRQITARDLDGQTRRYAYDLDGKLLGVLGPDSAMMEKKIVYLGYRPVTVVTPGSPSPDPPRTDGPQRKSGGGCSLPSSVKPPISLGGFLLGLLALVTLRRARLERSLKWLLGLVVIGWAATTFALSPDSGRVLDTGPAIGAQQSDALPDGSQAHAVVTDAVGTSVALLDGSGQAVWDFNATPFGRTRNSARPDGIDRDPDGDGKETTFPLRLLGQLDERHLLGLDAQAPIFHGARLYDSTLGQFLSPDPVALGEAEWLVFSPQHLSPYGYALADPLSYTDRTGLAIDTALDAGFFVYHVYLAITDSQCRWSHIGAAALDLVALAIPGVTMLGVVSKAGRARTAGHVADLVTIGNPTRTSAPVGVLRGRQLRHEFSGSLIKRLKRNMQRRGFATDKAIDVAIVDGRRIILDGHHRARAAGAAGIREVPVKIWQVSDEVGKRLLRQAAEAAENLGLPW